MAVANLWTKLRARRRAAVYWSGEKAYEEIKKYDFEDSFFYPRSLKKYVLASYEQFRSLKTSKTEAVLPTP